ncbi:AMP-binding protein [Streptacidiphilus sp. 4-A2]|nr:AMP-binding protein [Streptacidiphilus sp. 4-A2]
MVPDVAKFDLTLMIRPRQEVDGAPMGLVGEITYATDVFDAVTVESMTRRLVSLLVDVAGCPGVSVGGLSMLFAGEGERLLGWGSGVGDVGGVGVVGGFGVGGVGAGCGGGGVWGVSVSYRELDVRSERLAWLLRGRFGVGCECGVAMERSVDLLVVFLAVLKAGGAYVPVPVGYPLGLVLGCW